MRSTAELESTFRSWSVAPEAGRVVALVRRLGDGAHDMPDAVEISEDLGVVGDRWSTGKRDLRAQVSLMEARVAALVADDTDVAGVGDNLLVDLDLSVGHLPAGTRLRVGQAVLEVTDKPHLGCKKFTRRFGVDAMSWVNDPGHRDRRLRGLLTRVVSGGLVRVGDPIRVVP